MKNKMNKPLSLPEGTFTLDDVRNMNPNFIDITMRSRISKEIEKPNIISRFTPQTSKKILLKNNKMIGLQFVGTIRNTGTFYSLMKKGDDIGSISERLLDDNFVIAPDI